MTSKGNSGKSTKPAKRRGQTAAQSNRAVKHDEAFEKNFGDARHKPTLALQQALLNVFKSSFSKCYDDGLPQVIQQVKGHLFDRNFTMAFDSKLQLEAYSLRWSPSRALAYMDLVCGIPQISALLGKAQHGSIMPLQHGQASLPLDKVRQAHTSPVGLVLFNHQTAQDFTSYRTTFTCFGGGAGAEIMAFAGHMRCLLGSESTDTSGLPDDQSHNNLTPFGAPEASGLTLKIIDVADWSTVVATLHAGATAAPPLSKYAASNSKIDRRPLLDPMQFSVEFEQQDILCLEGDNVVNTLRDSALITLFFTLNELYTASKSKATDLLLRLSSLTQPGALLLVVDSPGSYSTVRVGNSPSAELKAAERRYPMKWLLDYTLLELSSTKSNDKATQTPQWEKLLSNDSKWFRLSAELKYPLDLEDMRYQCHLYRRI